jgi:hypothetical protein
MSFYVHQCPSMPIHALPCPPMPFYVHPCPFMSIHAPLRPSMSFHALDCMGGQEPRTRFITCGLVSKNLTLLVRLTNACLRL